ncbi:MAG: glycerophosphodiester phosphodiesterase family protein [Patescibacteria group bacterium]|nr:glycerophosphodiester phosphodiesterase family protein [Patescibacteria group bacterium]
MFMKIGHRGAMGYAPENTLQSFRKALTLGVDMVELDVYICKTGELVVIHDDKVDRTTNGHGYVIEKTYQELRSLNAGAGENIPSLQEVFDLIDRKAIINIELKGLGTAKPVSELITWYINNKNWESTDFLVSSFNHYELKAFRRLNPKIPIGALITGIPIGYAKFAEQLNAYSINPCIEFITKEFVDDAHARNIKVFVWTVNDQDDIERMKRLDVDGMFSNFPDRL